MKSLQPVNTIDPLRLSSAPRGRPELTKWFFITVSFHNTTHFMRQIERLQRTQVVIWPIMMQSEKTSTDSDAISTLLCECRCVHKLMLGIFQHDTMSALCVFFKDAWNCSGDSYCGKPRGQLRPRAEVAQEDTAVAGRSLLVYIVFPNISVKSIILGVGTWPPMFLTRSI